MISALVEDYVKTVYRLSHDSRGDGPVTTSALAAHLGVAPATVTAMIQKLARPEIDLLRYTPYQGVWLTPCGEQLALKVIRRHRLLELYLAERLGLRWDEVHAEAERLEHYISPVLEERIAAVLGDPQVDPHGHPIPSRWGQISRQAGITLAGLAANEEAVILCVQDGDPEFLRYLAARGLYPGVPLVIAQREPFGGSLHVRVGCGADRRDCTVSVPAAERIQVAACPSDKPTPRLVAAGSAALPL